MGEYEDMLPPLNNEPFGGDELADAETLAVQWARRAGVMAIERFWQPLHVEFKRENRSDPVTEADRQAEAFLQSAILREFPDHAILGEEGTEIDVEKHDFLWVLDPIDGTTNFLNGLPLFASSVALLCRGEPVVGAIFLPVSPRPLRADSPSGEKGEPIQFQRLGSSVLHARLGGGAFLDGEPVRVSEDELPQPSSLSGVPGHHALQFRRTGRLRAEPGELRGLGSVCFETAMVACGVFRYAVFRGPRIWDVAAGSLIIREAGGRCMQWQRRRWVPLTRFEPMERPDRRTDVGLRYWRAPVLMGGSRVTEHVADGIQPAVSLRWRIRGLLSRLWPAPSPQR